MDLLSQKNTSMLDKFASICPEIFLQVMGNAILVRGCFLDLRV